MLMGYYNIDSDLDVIQTNITKHFHSQKAPHVSDKNWQELTPHEKKFGINYLPKANSTIIGAEDLRTTPPSNSINLHKMSANYIISHIQGIDNLMDIKPQDNNSNKKVINPFTPHPE